MAERKYPSIKPEKMITHDEIVGFFLCYPMIPPRSTWTKGKFDTYREGPSRWKPHLLSSRGKEMAPNLDAFNQVVGLLFDQLYRHFPIAIEIEYKELAAKLGIEVQAYEAPIGFLTARTDTFGNILPEVEFEAFVDNTMEFLEEEGFIQRQNHDRIRLSAKGLAVLNAQLPGLEMAAGDKIVEISKEIGNSAGRVAMGEIIGQVIGAAARSILG